MSNELLTIDPVDVQFHFELKKQISCSLYLTNKTDNYVAFKVKTTHPIKYGAMPNAGIVHPRSSCELLVTMGAQQEAPIDMKCEDKFLIQCVVSRRGATANEFTPETFSKEEGHQVEETKLKVIYVAPPQPPPQVREGSEASVSDNRNATDFSVASTDLIRMSNELLAINPVNVQFPFELKKQISCSLYLTNKTDNYVAFKVKLTNPKMYRVRPSSAVVLPSSSFEVLVIMHAQEEAPADMQCKEKFLVQCVVARPGATAKEITREMFSKEAGHRVEETKLGVIYVAPVLVRQESQEGSSPRASVSDNGNASYFAVKMLRSLWIPLFSAVSSTDDDKINPTQYYKITEAKKNV